MNIYLPTSQYVKSCHNRRTDTQNCGCMYSSTQNVHPYEPTQNSGDWRWIRSANYMIITVSERPCNIFIANLTFMLPCIVMDFFLNNQPGALIIQICSVIKLYMFRASSLPIIRSFLLYIHQWWVSCRFDDRFQAESGWNSSPSWIGLEAVIKNLHETHQW